MTDQTTKAIDATTETVKDGVNAAAAVSEKTADAAADVAKQSVSTAQKAVKASTDATKAAATKSARTAAKATKTKARRTKAKRTVKRAQPKPEAVAANERNDAMNFNANTWFAPIGGQTASFQNLFADAGDRGQEAVRRTQKATEEFADLTRANVEALVEAGKIAVEGVRSIGQEAVENGREGVEKAADAVRQLAEAGSPTEFVQLQTEFARSYFDRIVSESSRMTESMVKLAGDAIQPISSRASLNAERLNKLVA